MNKADSKKLTGSELKSELALLKKELFDLRLSTASTHVKDNSQFRKLRVRIAQVLTLIKQEEQA